MAGQGIGKAMMSRAMTGPSTVFMTYTLRIW